VGRSSDWFDKNSSENAWVTSREEEEEKEEEEKEEDGEEGRSGGSAGGCGGKRSYGTVSVLSRDSPPGPADRCRSTVR
jgi:hypothetical protein